MLRFGTVGTSAIMHAAQQAMAQTDGVECRAVYSRDLSRGRAFADSVGVAAVCSDYDALLAAFASRMVYTPVSPYRNIHRDLALIAPEDMSCGEIEAVIRSSCKLVSEVRLFDIYRGGQVPSGCKSMAFALTFTPDDKELMPEDADKFIAKILKALEYRLGLKIRS